jgi:hypothetical protein
MQVYSHKSESIYIYALGRLRCAVPFDVSHCMFPYLFTSYQHLSILHACYVQPKKLVFGALLQASGSVPDSDSWHVLVLHLATAEELQLASLWRQTLATSAAGADTARNPADTILSCWLYAASLAQAPSTKRLLSSPSVSRVGRAQ